MARIPMLNALGMSVADRWDTHRVKIRFAPHALEVRRKRNRNDRRPAAERVNELFSNRHVPAFSGG